MPTTLAQELTRLEKEHGLELLNERNVTHGSFANNAKISQYIKAAWAAVPLTDVQREALDMIALKISRIVSGKADVKDHWDDIAGYATLAAEECERNGQKADGHDPPPIAPFTPPPQPYTFRGYGRY